MDRMRGSASVMAAGGWVEAENPADLGIYGPIPNNVFLKLLGTHYCILQRYFQLVVFERYSGRRKLSEIAVNLTFLVCVRQFLRG